MIGWAPQAKRITALAIPKRIEHVTVRKFALDACHQAAREAGLNFAMTHHFLQRVEVRAYDQNEVFVRYLRAVRFMLSRRAEFGIAKEDGFHPKIAIDIEGDRFILKVDQRQVTSLTYFHNTDRDFSTVFADRKFALKKKEDHE